MPSKNGPSTEVLADLTSFRKHTSVDSDDYHRFDRRGKWLINPYSNGMQVWDVILIFGLAYTSLVTPFDAAFLEFQTGDPIFYFNLAVDIIFAIDIILTFHLPFVEPVTGLWVTDKRRIAERYIRTWFIIDVLSVFPFDWIVLVFYDEDDLDAQSLRALRLLKLLKIFRIVRGNRIYKRWKDRIGINLTFLSMAFYIVFTLLMAHWIACILGVIPSIEGSFVLTQEQIAAGERPFNWQTEYFESNLGFEAGSYGVWTIYLASLYWSIMTLTTIGFGDVSPKTDLERVFMSFLMFFGASLQAYLIGTVCGLVAELAESETNFRKEINSLNEFMRAYGFPDELRVRLRRYFAYKHTTKDTRRYAHLFDNMSPHLQTETSIIVNSVWVKQVPFIEMAHESESQDLVVSLSKRLVSEVFAPYERVVTLGQEVTKLYIIAKGLVVLHMDSDPLDFSHDQMEIGNMNVRLSVSEKIRAELIRGECFGHELIYAGIRSLYNCTTIQFCELHVLTKDALDEVLEDFPLSKANIQRYADRQKEGY